MKSLLFVSLVLCAVLARPSFASGFICDSVDGYRVQLYHHINPSKGTRNPATFVLSSVDRGTLLVRYDSEIAKTSFSTSTLYSVFGNAETHSDRVSLTVKFKEGVDEKRGLKTVGGYLSFLGEEGEVGHGLTCTRYLKGKPETF